MGDETAFLSNRCDIDWLTTRHGALVKRIDTQTSRCTNLRVCCRADLYSWFRSRLLHAYNVHNPFVPATCASRFEVGDVTGSIALNKIWQRKMDLVEPVIGKGSNFLLVPLYYSFLKDG